MYNNDYEEYMREVLGYNSMKTNIHNDINNENYYQSYLLNRFNEPNLLNQQNPMNPIQPNFAQRDIGGLLQSNIEDLYPDIYKIINPVVSKVCRNNTKPVTEESLEEMISEVYNTVNIDELNIVNIKIETNGDINQTSQYVREIKDQKEFRENRENRDTRIARENKVNKEERENRDDRKRRPNNPLIRDLIRILILNQILGRNFNGIGPYYRNYQENVYQNPYLNGPYNYMNF